MRPRHSQFCTTEQRREPSFLRRISLGLSIRAIAVSFNGFVRFIGGLCVVAGVGCAKAPASPAVTAASRVAATSPSSSAIAVNEPVLSWDQSQSVLERRILPSESSASLPWDERIRQLLVEEPGDVILTAVGDVIFNRKLSDLPEPDHRNLFRILREADISFANLEMTIHQQPNQNASLYDFGVRPEFAWELANTGINLVNLANNHTLDFGGAGLVDCMKALDAADIPYAGAGPTLAAAHVAGSTRVQHTGTRFGLLGYLRHWSARRSTQPDIPTVATIDPATIIVERPGGTLEPIEGIEQTALAAMQDDIILAKRRHPFLMVSIHAHDLSHSRAFGFPQRTPDNDAVMYHQAIDAGADVVFAHGPHVLRGIELYKGKPIFYSLGNFIYHYRRKDRMSVDIVHQRNQELERPTNVSVYDRRNSPEEMECVVARLTLNQERVKRIELIPVSLDREGSDFGTPRLPIDARGQEILDRIERLAAQYKTKFVRKGWYAEVVLPPAQ